MTQEEKFSLLIPRFLNKDLSAIELEEFETYLSQNPNFAAEITFEENLMFSAPDLSGEERGMEFGWARLSRAIDGLETEATPKQEPLRAEINKLDENKAKQFSGYWKVAAVLLACLTIGQSVYISNFKTAPEYLLASDKLNIGTTIQIEISKDANFGKTSALLAQHKAQIISGPGKLGIYTLSFSDMKSCQSAMKAFNLEEQFVDTHTSCSDNP